MLTADLAQSWRRGGRTGPRLLDTTDAALLRTAAELIHLVYEHEGKARGELQAAFEAYVGTGTDYRILRGLIKLLSDVCEFETISVVEPAEIRRRLFLDARAHHPLLPPAAVDGEQAATQPSERHRAALVATLAREHSRTSQEIEDGLYADLAAEQRLTAFDEPSPTALLDRYNLAQAQALLYRAVEMRLSIAPQEAVHARFIFDAIKAYGLVHSIAGAAQSGYEVTLTGPVSLFHRSQKYGVQMAVFLPALLLCKGWYMRAEIVPREREAKAGDPANLFYELDAGQDALRTHLLPAPRHGGDALEKLLTAWTRTGRDWTLERTSEVIDLGAGAFVPDLVATHPNGRRIYVELFGFWTPAHLARRTAEFDREGFTDWLIITADELRCSREPPARIPANVLTCKSAPDATRLKLALDGLL